MFRGIISLIIVLFVAESAVAFPATGRTHILPKGRRAFNFSQLNLSVPGSYDQFGGLQNFSQLGSLQFNDLQSASTKIKKVIDAFEEISPGVAQNLELGRYNISPQVQARATILGIGYGITDNLMLGFGAPIINASVNLSGNYTVSNRLSQVADELRTKAKSQPESNRQKMRIMAQLLERAPQVTPEVLQHYFVNEMGYKPLGSWSANDIGDTRIFLHYNYLTDLVFRSGVRLAVDLPTGRKDDPDLLTDFGFGSETTALSVESIHDIALLGPLLTISSSLMYKANAITVKEVRLTNDLPISDVKESVQYKRGDTFEFLFGSSSQPRDDLEFFAQVLFSNKFTDEYTGKHEDYDYNNLSEGTDTRSQTYTVGATYSAVQKYLDGGFLLPFKLTLSSSEMMNGLNTEKFQYTQMDMQFFF